jgi:hypothetical protein
MRQLARITRVKGEMRVCPGASPFQSFGPIWPPLSTGTSCWNYHLLAIWSPILSLLAIMTRASVEHSGQNLPIQGNFCAPFGSFTTNYSASSNHWKSERPRRRCMQRRASVETGGGPQPRAKEYGAWRSSAARGAVITLPSVASRMAPEAAGRPKRFDKLFCFSSKKEPFWKPLGVYE